MAAKVAAPLPTAVQLGAVIRQLRVEREMTIEALAKASDLHWTYLSGIERGLRNPTVKALNGISGSLELRLSELIRRAEELHA